LVKRGASPGAKVLVFKTAEEMPMKLMEALRGAFRAVTKGEGPDGTALNDEDEAMAAVEALLTEATEKFHDDEEEDMTKEQQEQVAKAEEAVAKAQEDVAKAQADVAKAQAEAAEALAMAKAAEVKAETLAKAEAYRVNVAKATDLLGALPGDPAALATILPKLTEDEAKTLGEVFKAAQEGFALLTVERGRNTALTTGPLAEITKAATSAIKQYPHLTPSQAIAKALEADPKLYEHSLA
jgi:membrane protein involved in colicin uptake